MPKAKLTNRFISKASCPANKQKELYYDTEIAGFILDVRRVSTTLILKTPNEQ